MFGAIENIPPNEKPIIIVMTSSWSGRAMTCSKFVVSDEEEEEEEADVWERGLSLKNQVN